MERRTVGKMKAAVKFISVLAIFAFLIVSAFLFSPAQALGSTSNGNVRIIIPAQGVDMNFNITNSTNVTLGNYMMANLSIDENITADSITIDIFNLTYPAGYNFSVRNDTMKSGYNASWNFTNMPLGAFNYSFYWRNQTGVLWNKTTTYYVYVLTSKPQFRYEVAPITNYSNLSNSLVTFNVSIYPGTYFANATVEIGNESGTKNFSLTCGVFKDLRDPGFQANLPQAPAYNCYVALNISDTNQTQWDNASINVIDGMGNINRTGLVYFKVANWTPVIGTGVLAQDIYNSSNAGNIYEHDMTVSFNVTSNNTDTAPCGVRLWSETVDTGTGIKNWTLNSTLIPGTYLTIGSVRRCNVTLNGSDIYADIGNVAYATFRLEAVAVTTSGIYAYGQNTTTTFNYLYAGWNPIGWTGTATTLRNISGYLNFNASYVSVRDNEFGNSTWITWQNGPGANNNTAVNNNNVSGVYVYMDNAWMMLRANATRVADTVWLTLQSATVNQSWSWPNITMNSSILCVGANLSIPINTSTLSLYFGTLKLVNSYSDVNGTWGAGNSGVPKINMTGGSNYTYNATCLNITSNQSAYINVTSINFTMANIPSSWNYVTNLNTNTTKNILTQCNCSDIAWFDRSYSAAAGGAFRFFTQGTLQGNETIIPAGAGIYLLPNSTGWLRNTTVSILNNGTVVPFTLSTTIMNGTSTQGLAGAFFGDGINGFVKVWSRPN